MPNRLSSETSPYLLQHADNPVDWFPWGPEAFTKARDEDKPIFLSVGYSACHWCHVMEHESFEDDATAALMNRHFVSIKVDREERPDVDTIYMDAVQALTQRGGWPMSVFLMPDGVPFYGGTYYPNRARYGMPSFSAVLTRIAELWATNREQLLAAGKELTAALTREAAAAGSGGAGPTRVVAEAGILDSATRVLLQSFDEVNGGWGGAPKFPQPAVVEFVLRRYLATGDERLLAMFTTTLDAMACGGIYDQLGGGFHRYATDAVWLVPHFEKMLYDNAQLARLYLHAWQVTGDESYRRVVIETLDYVVREMRDERGGFYSAQDADTEGVEGAFFVWTPAEIRAVADHACADPAGDTALFMAAFGVAPGGNFEGKSILYAAQDHDRAGAAPRHDRCGGGGSFGEPPRGALRSARTAGEAGPGRQGARELERPHARGLRRSRPSTGPRRLRGRRREKRRVRALRDAHARGPHAAHVEGRPGHAQRLPGRLCALRRRPAGALPVDLRSPLVPRRAGAR